MRLRNFFLLCLSLLATIGLLVNGGCNDNNTVTPSSPPVTLNLMNPQQLWSEMISTTKPVALDLRSADDYTRSHIPYSQPIAGWTYDKNAKLVLIGTTEVQEREAATKICAPGQCAAMLAGGFPAWELGLDISTAQLKQWVDEGRPMTLIDVRSLGEWQGGHIPNTRNLPVEQLAQWAPTLDPNAVYVLACKGGKRSCAARDALAQRGFTHVSNLVGGTDAWTYGLETGN